MNTQKFNARITPLSDAHKKTVHLIHRLSKLPASASTNPDAGNARLELSAEIHQNLKEQEEEFDLLRQEFTDHGDRGSWTARKRDSEGDRERAGLAAQITRLEEDLRSARSQFRKAQLQAKRNAESAKRKDRELLFELIREGTSPLGPSGRRRGGQEKLSQDELLLNASKDVTAALRETHSLMQAEASRSQFAHDTLQQSTAALSTLSESYGNLDSLLSSSRSLVSSLLHSQKSDTWYLESAFWILVCTIAWLAFRRLVYGPAWWLLYQPTKLILQFTIFLLELILGTFAAFAGASQRSGALSSAVASENIIPPTSSLTVHPSATGAIPKLYPSMSAPNIAVGGGGAGAKEHPYRPQAENAKSVIPQVEKRAAGGESAEKQADSEKEGTTNDDEDAKQRGTVLRERRDDEPPNPKKRMWEENFIHPSAQEDGPARDEL